MTDSQSCFLGEKILVVDDDLLIVKLTVLLLEKWGFQVFTASDGKQCLEMVARHRPALVLLDYMMPVMNGLEALRLIRAHYPDTSVIMFTGKGNEEVAVELMMAGAADYLRKPFVNGNLRERIEAVLATRKVELENRELLKERELLQNEIKLWNEKLEKRVLEKSSELEQAHKEIVQSEKLAALGHISAGMAHEIRNPLNSINLFAQILSTAEGLDEENRGYINKILQEVERIDEILIQMLASSSGKENKTESVDFIKIIEKVLCDSQARIEKQGINLDLDLPQEIPLLQADPLEIEQIFTNLISNALYEMPNGGVLSLSVTADAEKIVITIADTGRGIAPEYVQRIFDPFFTTKERGTGFGLSVVMRIVKSCGGQIHVDSTQGGGAQFIIKLPLLPDSVH
jgi:signal transduction histidine kinase